MTTVALPAATTQRSHTRILVGVEVEAYSISTSDYQIGRGLSRPRPGLGESGERFARDSSIGSEYNSRPFRTVRESLFLLKSGLRKYFRGLYRSQRRMSDLRVPLLVGGWTNRFAGTHLHLSVEDMELDEKSVNSLAWAVHDQVPLLIAVMANSPIWNKRITGRASSRLLRGSDTYFMPAPRGRVRMEENREMLLNPVRKTKPATLELRMLDSNVPEFIVVAICVLKAVTLRWLRNRPACNRMRYADYLAAREAAGRLGVRCKLPWREEWLPFRDYLDRFIWEHRRELEQLDIPDEIWDVMRLLKRGFNGARIIHDAARVLWHEHPQTWQRRFAKRYRHGLEMLLSGNTLRSFASELGVALPRTDRVWLGRRGATIGG